jgi:hypothetical protein
MRSESVGLAPMLPAVARSLGFILTLAMPFVAALLIR